MVRRLGFIVIALSTLVDRSFAAGSECSVEDVPRAKQSTYWLETAEQHGISPLNPESGYKVRRNVKDYGAVGDGSADDSDAIKCVLLFPVLLVPHVPQDKFLAKHCTVTPKLTQLSPLQPCSL